MRYELRPEVAGAHHSTGRSCAVLTERDEMIAESLQFSAAVKTCLEEVKPGGTVEIVLHVVLPVPQQLDRRARLFRYPCGLDHVVIHQAPAEAAAAASHVDGDVRLVHAQGLGDDFAPCIGILGRRPDLHFSIMDM